MAKINVLEKQVAELIAAGEVVERPASIVKELVENAVDAGAAGVTVEIQAGGIRYIRVTDNGCGIERDDVENAFLRHATSKLRDSDDLNHITTMGFRGEALASIAAMCRVEVLTRTASDIAGTLYAIAGGEPERLDDAGCPVGTTITVRDVFFNTPARMKFLKKDVSEGNSVAAVIEKTALGNPSVAFKFIRDGVVKLQTPGDGKLISVIRCILGREFAENAVAVNYTQGGISVDGYISKPSAARGSRSLQNFFINTRFIRSKTCMVALEESFRNMLMVGRFPSCVLNLTIPPQTVDVNVHPAKTEVRFANEKSIFDLVYYGCKTALCANELQPQIKLEDVKYNPFKEKLPKEIPEQKTLHVSVDEYKSLLERQLHNQPPKATVSAAVLEYTAPIKDDIPAIPRRHNIDIAVDEPPRTQDSDFISVEAYNPFQRAPDAKIKMESASDIPAPASVVQSEPQNSIYDNAVLIGEVFGTYIILQSGSEVVFVDKHAAHERILFNRLMEKGVGEDKQLLLTPVSVALSPEEHDAVLENKVVLSEAGLCVEDFGDGFVIVREVAPVLSDADLSGIVTECAGKLLNCSRHLIPRQLEDLYHTIACRAAVKAHDKTPAPSLEQLIALLKEDGDVDHCPHGRPVAIKLTKHELEKKFGRLG